MSAAKLLYTGKVRNVYELDNRHLLLEATDRTSGFNKYICDINNKGVLLNMMSDFWFEKTKHIIPNHLIYADDRYSIVKKCTPFKIEVVVRGYITGNTETSLWTHYNNGSRVYCGILFPDGLVKNQKLDFPVVTPTTKDDNDRPITPEEIVSGNFMTQEQMEYVFNKALELYNFGSEYAETRGLLLVDTKYEFGLDMNNNIILIDEVHTCDSSRYWLKDTYDEKFRNGKSPEKFDKDQVRDWVKTQCDPYTQDIPIPPNNIINLVYNSYYRFYKKLTGLELVYNNKTVENILSNYELVNDKEKKVVILYGSKTDESFVNKICYNLNKFDIEFSKYEASAHKKPKLLLKVLEKYEGQKLVWITVAGRSNALSGVVAAQTKQPCIACPPFQDKIDIFTNVNSSLQMPSNVPVMTVLDPYNAVLAANKILDL
jgi:phosphoribosylaminoimidazole-succinocarboxamide synthase